MGIVSLSLSLFPLSDSPAVCACAVCTNYMCDAVSSFGEFPSHFQRTSTSTCRKVSLLQDVDVCVLRCLSTPTVSPLLPHFLVPGAALVDVCVSAWVCVRILFFRCVLVFSD